MSDLPMACTLGPDGMAARLASIDARLGGDQLARTLLDLRCCAFLDFSLDRDGGDLVLDITGPRGARSVIDMFFAPAAS